MTWQLGQLEDQPPIMQRRQIYTQIIWSGIGKFHFFHKLLRYPKIIYESVKSERHIYFLAQPVSISRVMWEHSSSACENQNRSLQNQLLSALAERPGRLHTSNYYSSWCFFLSLLLMRRCCCWECSRAVSKVLTSGCVRRFMLLAYLIVLCRAWNAAREKLTRAPALWYESQQFTHQLIC